MSKEQIFHGQDYSDASWNSKNHVCCLLCKTKNCKLSRTRHWSKGLCRSCYRRLNIKHRLYNDSYNKKEKSGTEKKKHYKMLSDYDKFKFSQLDVETLLDRYDWCCAYSRIKLQGYNHTRPDAFQLEYLIINGKPELIPICRAANCSKKNITSEEDLKRWCESKGYNYPIKVITLQDYLNS